MVLWSMDTFIVKPCPRRTCITYASFRINPMLAYCVRGSIVVSVHHRYGSLICIHKCTHMNAHMWCIWVPERWRVTLFCVMHNHLDSRRAWGTYQYMTNTMHPMIYTISICTELRQKKKLGVFCAMLCRHGHVA